MKRLPPNLNRDHRRYGEAASRVCSNLWWAMPALACAGLGMPAVGQCLNQRIDDVNRLPAYTDSFGAAVAIAAGDPGANAPVIAAVGNPGRLDAAGNPRAAVHFYSNLAGSSWAPLTSIVDPTPAQPGNTEFGAVLAFGTPVAIGSNPTVHGWHTKLAIGAPGSHQGYGAIVLVEYFVNYAGSNQSVSTPTIVYSPGFPTGPERFGASIAFRSSTDMIVGAPSTPGGNNEPNQGEVYDITTQTPLSPGVAGLGANSRFGSVVSYSNGWLMVGSAGKVHVFSGLSYQYDLAPPSVPGARLTGQVSVSGDKALVGYSVPCSPPGPCPWPTTYVAEYRLSGTAWAAHAAPLASAHQFAINGDKAVLQGDGALQPCCCYVGGARVISYDGSSWSLERVLPGSFTNASIAIHGPSNAAIVGSSADVECCPFQPCERPNPNDPNNPIPLIPRGAAYLNRWNGTPVSPTLSPLNVCPNTTATWVASSSEVPPPTFQWYRQNGSGWTPLVSGAAYTINSVVPADAGLYRVDAVNSCGVITSTTATLTVDVAPHVSPISVSGPNPLCDGATVTLSVAAGGTLPLTYTWYHSIGGNAQTPVVTSAPNWTPPPLSGTLHNFFVAVSNACAPPASSPQLLLPVNAPPTASISAPTPRPYCIGDSVSYSVAAPSGSPPITFEWFKRGLTVLGPSTTATTYVAGPLAPADDGAQIEVEARNSCGTTGRLHVATLSVRGTAPVITFDPQDTRINEGQNGALSVAATGSNLTYQWQRETSSGVFVPVTDGAHACSGSSVPSTIMGASTSVLQFQNMCPADAGNYRVIVSADCLSSAPLASAPAALTVTPYCPEGGVNSRRVISYVLAGAPNNTRWSWKITSTNPGAPFQDTAIVNAGPVASNLTLADVAIAFADSIDQYFTTLPRPCDIDEIDAEAYHYNGIPPFVPPQDILYVNTGGGSGVDLWVGPLGTPACRVYTPGVACTFNPSIEIIPLPGLDCNGNGKDDILDIGGGESIDANTNNIPDECETPCTITMVQRPRSRAAAPGQTATFSTSANSSDSLNYQWRRDGVDLVNGPTALGSVIAGADSPILIITNLRPGDAARYSAVVFNACGSIISSSARLTVACVSDWNRDDVVNSQDFFDFLTAFFRGDADLNGDGVTNSQDFFDFLTAFFAGC